MHQIPNTPSNMPQRNADSASQQLALVQPRLAAVELREDNLADHVVDIVIGRLLAQGYNIVGLRQRILDTGGGGCGVRLQSISNGEYHRMTQDLGSGSTSCNIDADALERLAEMQKNEIKPGVDLVIVNRFGKRESQGGGFCNVIERASELDIPVLTVVNATFLSNWLEYGGDFVTSLPADEQIILLWANSILNLPPTVVAN